MLQLKWVPVVPLFFSLIFPATAPAAEEKAPFKARVLISVESTVNSGKDWSKDACRRLHEMLSGFAELDSRCMRLDSIEELFNDTIGNAEKSKEYLYHVQLRELGPKSYRLMVENWLAEDDTEPRRMVWELETRENDSWEKDARGPLANVFEFAKNRDVYKQIFLAHGLNESNRLKVDDKGRIIDTATGKELSGKEAYRIFASEGVRQKNYLMAALEIGAVIGFSTINYFHPIKGGRNPNVPDWEYWGWEGQKQKYSGNMPGIRFDDNGFDVNRGHALAGMIYYQIARNEGLSTLESFLYSFAASSVWEMATEHREVLSINDQILTPVGGYVLGEVFHQMSQLLLSRSNSLPAKVLATLFDLPGAMSRWEGRNNSGFRNLRATGFDADTLSHFDLYAGVKTGQNPDNKSASGTTFGVRGEVVSIPLFDEPGNVSKLYTDSVFSELLVSGTMREAAFDNFSLLAKVVFAAYHKKSLSLDEAGRRNGYTMYFGASSGVEYEDTSNRADHPDLNATVHVLGSSMDLSAYVNGIRIRAKIDVFGDFAMVNSYALDMYKKSNSTDGTISTIDHHGYYYASGITARSNLSVSWNKIEAGYAVSKQSLDSINSRNRNQSVVTKDLDYSDELTKQEAYITYNLNKSWKLRFSIERIDRSGTISGGYSDATTETRKMGTLIYTF